MTIETRPIVRVAAPGFPWAPLPAETVILEPRTPTVSLAPGAAAAVTLLLKGKLNISPALVARFGRTHMTAEWHLQFNCLDGAGKLVGYSDFTEATAVRGCARV